MQFFMWTVATVFIWHTLLGLVIYIWFVADQWAIQKKMNRTGWWWTLQFVQAMLWLPGYIVVSINDHCERKT